MSEILSQQQAEKDILREAAAARSLQDIQAEQEFQEWWDKESARLREEEEVAKAVGSGAGAKVSKGARRGGKSGPRRGGGGGKGKSGAVNAANAGTAPAGPAPATGKSGQA